MLMDKETAEAWAEQQAREIKNLKAAQLDGYLTALNDLRTEVFKNIDWGDNHGNMGLMSKRQINKMINSLKTSEAKNGSQ